MQPLVIEAEAATAPAVEGLRREVPASSEEEEEDDEPPAKVYSLWNPPPSEEIEGEAYQDALELVFEADFPMLTALFGIATSPDEMPALSRMREVLGLDDAETRSLFRLEDARTFSGRVHEFRGRLTPSVDKTVGSSARSLMRQLGSRAAAVTTRSRFELFLLPGEGREQAFPQPQPQPQPVTLFVFLRGDLPRFEPTETSAYLTRLLLISAVLLCNANAFAAWPFLQDLLLLERTDGLELSDIWPLGPSLLLTLLAGTGLRAGSARWHRVEISQFTMPSVSLGHLGSMWLPHDFFPNWRTSFDIAASCPSASLLVSAGLTSYGAWHVAGVKPTDAPFQVPAIELPTVLVQLLGYQLPETQAEQLITLATRELTEAPREVLVGADPWLLSGAFGLTVASVNLLPMGGFDGYAIARAAFGPKVAGVLEFVSLGILCNEVGREDARGVFASEVVLAWLLQSLLGNRRDELMPPRDSVSEPGLARQALAVVLFGLSAAILMPPP